MTSFTVNYLARMILRAVQEIYLVLVYPTEEALQSQGLGEACQAVNFSDSYCKQTLPGGSCDLTPPSEREAEEQREHASLFRSLCASRRGDWGFLDAELGLTSFQ